MPTVAETAAILAISTGVSLGASRRYAGRPASISAPMKRAA
jgi:hypothetical protein